MKKALATIAAVLGAFAVVVLVTWILVLLNR
jgi:hypothetical protein